MSELDDRIARFETMAAADPDNDMAHFSLGNAYLQGGRNAEAAKSLQKCIEINPEMSKAYELAGKAMINAGWSDMAVETLNKGYEVAAKKGDQMPRKAIADLLESIGRTPPEVEEKTASFSATGGGFICTRTGREGSQLDEQPFRGSVGLWIYENISAETWREWIAQGTKVINELRLDFSRVEDQETYDMYMREYLGIDEELQAKLTGGINPSVS